MPRLSRRLLLTGAAGSAGLLGAPVAVHAQAPAAPPSPTGARSAVIEVNRARTDPIPIAIPPLGGSDGSAAQLGQEIATVVTNDLARSGLFRPIAPGAFIQGGGSGDAPNFQNWKAIGAQALVTGRTETQGGGQVRVEFRLSLTRSRSLGKDCARVKPRASSSETGGQVTGGPPTALPTVRGARVQAQPRCGRK
jgi:TolB protein